MSTEVDLRGSLDPIFAVPLRHAETWKTMDSHGYCHCVLRSLQAEPFFHLNPQIKCLETDSTNGPGCACVRPRQASTSSVIEQL
jgi:hypothetical protein